jgi:hypothetical protein
MPESLTDIQLLLRRILSHPQRGATRREDLAMDIALKCVIAPVIFGAFLYFVSGIRMHRAAGMMLTFPALNGITLAFSPNALSLPSGMLPMIAVNGLLCLAFIQLFEVISSHLSQQWWIGKCLFFLGCAIWYGASRVMIPVPITWQPPFIGGYAVLAAAVTIVLWYHRPVAKAGGIRVPILDFLKDQKLWGRIGLFEGIFIAVLAFDHRGSTIFAGQLGAAPLLPLFGLAVIAEGTDPVQELKRVKISVLLGPIFAMSFVFVLAPRSALVDLIGALMMLLGAWTLCFLGIWLLSLVFQLIETRSQGPHTASPTQ